MKVLVTGAAGFIGSHIVDALRDRGDTVIGIDSLDPGVHHGAPDYLRDDVEYCFADLRTGGRTSGSRTSRRWSTSPRWAASRARPVSWRT